MVLYVETKVMENTLKMFIDSLLILFFSSSVCYGINTFIDIFKHKNLVLANNGVMGGVGNEAIQRICGGIGVVPRPHG